MAGERSKNEPTDGQSKILSATFAVLGDEGYDGLSIQRIADEADLSKATVYHHFDDKDELLLAFLDYVAGRFRERLTDMDDLPPAERLGVIIDRMVLGDVNDPANQPSESADRPLRAFVEIRAKAAHDATYRASVTKVDQVLQAYLAETIREGVQNGSFRAVDADEAANELLTLLTGALLRRATTDVDLNAIHAMAHRSLDELVDPD